MKTYKLRPAVPSRLIIDTKKTIPGTVAKLAMRQPFVLGTVKQLLGALARQTWYHRVLRKLFKNPCCQAEWNKNVPFGFS